MALLLFALINTCTLMARAISPLSVVRTSLRWGFLVSGDRTPKLLARKQG